MKVVRIVLLIVSSLTIFLGVAWLALPDVGELKRANPPRTALMRHRGGPQNQVRQIWVPASQIHPNLRRAVLVSEDASFFEHHGIDFHEFRNSFFGNLATLRWRRGFSTISMQLAKNLYLTPRKSVVRKFLEILISQKMEWTIPKARILEIYLNIVEWGDGIYGAEAASRHYFHKPARELTAWEAAFLAAILPNPLDWGTLPPGPFVARRQERILRKMGFGP